MNNPLNIYSLSRNNLVVTVFSEQYAQNIHKWLAKHLLHKDLLGQVNPGDLSLRARKIDWPRLEEALSLFYSEVGWPVKIFALLRFCRCSSSLKI